MQETSMSPLVAKAPNCKGFYSFTDHRGMEGWVCFEKDVEDWFCYGKFNVFFCFIGA